MSKIVSIATDVPAHKHNQQDICRFMQKVYALDETENRKLRFLYGHSAIDSRYSVIPDYSLDAEDWQFYPATENLEPFPGLEKRMQWYSRYAPTLSVSAIEKCMAGHGHINDVTHLITVSCTGMSAPGLDLQIMEMMKMPVHIFRTSVNFMGCYAAIHAMKLADAFCRNDPHARVMVVCTELCTLHFQRDPSADNIASSLLFGDGCAAMLVASDDAPGSGLHIKDFYSEVGFAGKNHMSWQLSSSGFLMSLSSSVPRFIEEDFGGLLQRAIQHAGIHENDITQWCIHPGGKRILNAIEKSNNINANDLRYGYDILQRYGNMSSPTILFVLKEIMNALEAADKSEYVFGAAFGPGLTMESFILYS